MVVPTKEEFVNLGKTYNRITVYREIEGDSITPVILLKLFKNKDNLFLFESANLDKSFSRFSFFGHSPEKIIDSGDLEFLKNFSSFPYKFQNTKFINDSIIFIFEIEDFALSHTGSKK